MTEAELRDWMCRHGESLHARGLAHGSSGNLSARLADGILVTPTNSCLGRLDPVRISTTALGVTAGTGVSLTGARQVGGIGEQVARTPD